MEKAGRQTAIYSAPPSDGVQYWIHSPACAMTAWPEVTSISPFLWRTRTVPLSTRVNSSNSGVCPGSSQPCGLRMWATLTPAVFELMRPMYSSISLGLVPAAEMRVGCDSSVGMSAPLRRITLARAGATSEVKDVNHKEHEGAQRKTQISRMFDAREVAGFTPRPPKGHGFFRRGTWPTHRGPESTPALRLSALPAWCHFEWLLRASPGSCRH